MIAKLKIVEEEADEAKYWLELFKESDYRMPDLDALLIEAKELLAIVVASIKTLRIRNERP